jgi:hypothetical protein
MRSAAIVLLVMLFAQDTVHDTTARTRWDCWQQEWPQVTTDCICWPDSKAWCWKHPWK